MTSEEEIRNSVPRTLALTWLFLGYFLAGLGLFWVVGSAWSYFFEAKRSFGAGLGVGLACVGSVIFLTVSFGLSFTSAQTFYPCGSRLLRYGSLLEAAGVSVFFFFGS
jgi:hypothetical protein